jgi:hypothetical protein
MELGSISRSPGRRVLMNIELSKDLAHTPMRVQDELTRNEIKLDPARQPMWDELQRVCLHKVNEDFPLLTDFNVKGTQTMRFDHNNKLVGEKPIDGLGLITQAAYEWRAAEVHAAACKLGAREDDGLADAIELEKLTRLRILLDTLKKL